jgi:hypothetical protein
MLRAKPFTREVYLDLRLAGDVEVMSLPSMSAQVVNGQFVVPAGGQ